MRTIQIKSVFGKVLFEYEKENNTIKETVEEAVRQGANLRGADLCGANLSYANLRYADLCYADLSFNTCLFSSKTDKKYIQLGGIGSSRRATTYCIEDDIVLCGCFKGSLSEFKSAIEKTHASNPLYLAEYRAAVEYIEQQIKNYKALGKEAKEQ